MASLRSLRAGLRRSQLGDRCFHDFIRGSTQGSTYKVPLSSQKIVGLCTSRGSRPEQEDAASVHALQLSPGELQTSLDKLKEKIAWKPEHAGSDFLASQVAFFGIYDGHGGKEVSKYLKENLHSLLETVQPDSIGETVQWMVNTHEGYYRRWRGGRLQRWTRFSQSNLPDLGSGMTLEERITLAFLEADRQVLTTIDKAKLCGSTASVVLLHSLDEPCEPYWASKKLAVTIGHTGDTRVLLCPRETGQVIPLTEKHHAESRVEATRLRRMGTGNLVSDSFGESRWMGMIENTRGFGDGEFKPSGVTAEPEVHTRVLNGEDYSYIVLVTDGLTSLMSDQEIIDLARESIDPTRAAKSIVHFGEDLGAQDNCTCIVIPLAGWGKVGGKDTTEERREYRKKQAGMMSTRMSRM